MPMNTAYPPLDLTYIHQQLEHAPIGHTVHYHRAIPSTMPIAATLAQERATTSGTIIVTEEQTSGRGRNQRTWHAPFASALLVSIILKPPHSLQSAATLTMIAGNAILAAAATVAPTLADELHLKWPNDLVLGNDPATARKVAGILAESSIAPDGTLAHAILGIGTNVNQQANDLPRIAPPTPRPTSLRVASNMLIDRSELLVQLCQQLAAALMLTPDENYQRWKSHLATLGHQVAVYQGGVEQPVTLTGQAVDVQADGALVVVDDAGTRHTFHAADVSIRAASK